LIKAEVELREREREIELTLFFLSFSSFCVLFVEREGEGGRVKEEIEPTRILKNKVVEKGGAEEVGKRRRSRKKKKEVFKKEPLFSLFFFPRSLPPPPLRTPPAQESFPSPRERAGVRARAMALRLGVNIRELEGGVRVHRVREKLWN
jgi:hypothetical protein